MFSKMLFVRCLGLFLFVGLLVNPSFSRVARAAGPDFATTDGYFFSEANGQGGGDLGYSVTDADGVAFWSEFRRLGGVAVLGYPVSQRFVWKGTTVQVFQKVVMQWQPATRTAAFVNVFDELRDAGKDDWLKIVRITPKQTWLDNESGLAWSDIANQRLAFLDANPAIKAAYYRVTDPVTMYGLPASRIEDMGNAYVVRLQRAEIQQWKVNTPWAKAGDVTIANGGDVGKEAGLFPKEAVQPSAAPSPAAATPDVAPPGGQRTIVVDPGHGDKEIGASHRFGDGYVLVEKNINLKIALRVAALLRDAGYRVVLTRDADVAVNRTSADLNGDGQVTIDDDLQARVDLANKEKADLLLSIHNNGHDNPALRGTEVYYNPDRAFTAQSIRLAQIIQRNLVSGMRAAGYDTVDRGIKTDASARPGASFFILGPQGKRIARASQMPAVIGESLFVTNDADAAQLRSDAMIEAIARGYVAGVSQYFASDK